MLCKGLFLKGKEEESKRNEGERKGWKKNNNSDSKSFNEL
jgi:hypothetical protein